MNADIQDQSAERKGAEVSDIAFQSAGELVIKCCRCVRQVGFGEFASTNPRDTQESVARSILEKLGWRSGWYGWQCDQHGIVP